jgi:hypothetical protein
MALIDETIVEHWLRRRGYFTVRGLLNVRPDLSLGLDDMAGRIYLEAESRGIVIDHLSFHGFE